MGESIEVQLTDWEGSDLFCDQQAIEEAFFSLNGSKYRDYKPLTQKKKKKKMFEFKTG